MKKIIVMMITILFCVFSVETVNAESMFMAKKLSPKTIMISFYDNIKQDHMIENTKISFNKDISILSTMQLLKEKELIKDYSLDNDTITQVQFEDNSVLKVESEPYPTEFAVKQNGISVSPSMDSTMVKDGDIIEWIFSTKSLQVESANTPTSSFAQTKDGEKYWNDKTIQALNQATNWLHLNSNDNSSYLVSMGVAGRTADFKTVNDFVDSVKSKTEYKTPMELSKNIMALTFCGYDASLVEYRSLVKQLSNYENIMDSGVFGAVNTLIAYDTNQYKLPIGVINTREKLVANILEYQQKDGGFSIMKTSASDIDTTAMTITALSNYKEEANVEKAIEKALGFLSKEQTAKGGFGFQGQENLESLSSVIVALNSLNISLDDSRFRKSKQTLVDQLLSYQNSDGGFSHLKGDKSAAMPTEQAMVALTAIKRCGNPYILSIPITTSKQIPTEQVTVDKDNAFLFFLLGIVLLIVAISAIIITRGYIAKKENDRNKNR